MRSIETTLARGAARAAEQDWKAHQAHCPPCYRAVQSRKPGEVCDQGHQVRRASQEANRELRRNRELDKLPAPDQEALFR